MGISYQQHRIAIGCFNGRSLPSRRGELNPSAPSGVWQGLFLCHLVFSLAFNVSSSECWAATGYSQKVLNLIKQFPSGLLTPVAPSGVWQATACHLVVNQACGGEAFIMCFIWGIVVAILLLRSCVESNPGPEVEQLHDQVEDWEFKNVPDLEKVFKTRRTICAVCKVGKVKEVVRNTQKLEPILIYTRNGTKKAIHGEFRCVKKACRALHGCGFYKERGEKVYEEDALREEILVTSSCTALEIEYLIEIASSIEICGVNFEGMAKIYNRLHNQRLPSDVLEKRAELYKKRLTEGFFIYIYLELAQRYHIKDFQRIHSNIDTTILKHRSDLQSFFNLKWAKHKCETKGCGWVITIDGGLKPHRMVCAAKLSGVRIFPSSGLKIYTGCTKFPSPRSKFCSEHQAEESPVIVAENISVKTKENLRNNRTATKSYEGAGQDDFYIVESLVKMRDGEVEVKWLGFPDTTWEPKSNIPAFIRCIKNICRRSCLNVKLPLV